MKIYFEDGRLRQNEFPLAKWLWVDASFGYQHNRKWLNEFKASKQKDIAVYTNSLVAFSNEYAWNRKLKVPEIYIRDKNGVFTRIDKLTTRELREGHNLLKLYMGGEFGVK